MYTDFFTRICRGNQIQQIIGATVHADDLREAVLEGFFKLLTRRFPKQPTKPSVKKSV